jgi:hypothetical protein
MARLDLRRVTLCAASDVAMEPTLHAMERCLAQARFHDAMLLSSRTPLSMPTDELRHVVIAPLDSRDAYGDFILRGLAQHIESDFVLIVQWDSFITDPEGWTDRFLDFDYIGAPWPNFPDERNVGNGGFSLRSRRLLAVGDKPWFEPSHPEDLCLCHHNRARLDAEGFRFADTATARRFSREREDPYDGHFGIHGIFAIAQTMAPEAFSAMLAGIEPGVIGRRELLDLVQILRRRKATNRDKASLRRCAREFVRRFPLDRRTPGMVRFLA